MKSSIVVLLHVTSILQVSLAIDACTFAENCQVKEWLYRVHCTESECNCYNDDDSEYVDCVQSQEPDLSVITWETDHNAIEDICRKYPACKYWRWEKTPAETHTIDVYLVAESKCDNYKTCSEPNCYGGGVDCDGDQTTTTEVPNTIFCNTDSEHYHTSETKDNWLHWDCDYVNFYDSATKPYGTKCRASHKCYQFPDPDKDDPNASHMLEYECLKSDDGTKGQWRWTGKGTNNAIYDEIVLTDGTEEGVESGWLKEPTCNAAELALQTSNYYQDGMLITCTDGDGQMSEDGKTVSIPSENYCLLLCDNYPALSFFVQWKQYTGAEKDKGERVWAYQKYNSQDDAPIELRTDCSEIEDPADKEDCEANLVDNIIKCWDTQIESESWLAYVFSGKFVKLFQ